MTLLQSGIAKPSSGYDIDQSLRIENADGYLTKTFGSAGNRKTWTYSVWCKKALIDNSMYWFASDYSDSTNLFIMNLRASNATASKDYTLSIQWRISESTTRSLHTTQKFRDPSAWYHIVLVCDTTQASASDRLKLYVNGEQVTDFAIDDRSNISQDADTAINRAAGHQIGAWNNTSGAGGYYAEVHFIDGTALTPASFGETNSDTNQWQAINYAGSYGTNGFYLKFQDSAALGDDSSGNTNDFTPTNLVATDQVLDSPTRNYCTLNPLAPPRASGSFTYSEGNLKVSMGGTGDADCASTMGASSGKWYAEAYIVTGDQTTDTPFVGVVSSKFLDSETIASSSNSLVYYYTGNKRLNGTVTSYGATYNAGDIIGVAFNSDSNEVTFYKNNATQGAVSITADEYVFNSGRSGGTPVVVWNFGQDSSFAGETTAQGNGGVGEDFYYTPPTGYKALNTDNLDDPAIALPTGHFNTVLYSGNGGTNSITGTGFSPDLVWNKSRDGSSGHDIYDSVRGVEKSLASDETSAEVNRSTGLQSFDSDGFTTGDYIRSNYSGRIFVSWNWKAGGTASSNTDGSVTSSVSANTDAGMSIVTWTNNSSTVGHGLSQAPELIIVKSRTSVTSWPTYVKPVGNGYTLLLDRTDAQMSGSFWNSTTPTSSVFSVGADIGGATEDYLAYCFHSVDGYSKIGSYNPNNSTDGPFIYTGFKPSFVLIKAMTGPDGRSWAIEDNKRDPYNPADKHLNPNLSNAEAVSSVHYVDFVSNGFKLRNAHQWSNYTGYTYIYMAFAESPFKYSNAR